MRIPQRHGVRVFIYPSGRRSLIIGVFQPTPGTLVTYMSFPRGRVFPTPPKSSTTRTVAASLIQHLDATNLHGGG